jgi:cardiolipin synthase
MPHFTTSLQWPLTVQGHGALVLGGLLLYLTSTRLSRQHRHPSAALAWVLTIALLPYLGIPLYLLFGVRKVPRPQARSARDATAVSHGQTHWAFAMTGALALPEPTRNDEVAFHDDGQMALDGLLALIGEARHSIDLCTFVLGHDAVAQRIGDALKAAARRGVAVRMMLDELGCRTVPKAVLRALRRDGVEVQFFMPVLPNIRRGRANLRNHRKLLIVDRHKVWTGGRNLASEYFVHSDQMPLWTDISYVVTGPLASQASELYQQDWEIASGGRKFADIPLAARPSPANGALLQWIPSGPDHADDTLYALLLASAWRAERRIILVSPYFVPDDALLSAWCMACRRGVAVTLVVPSRSNHHLADVARTPSLRALMQAGADVVFYPLMLHAKAVIVDEDLAFCGSANLDSRSLFLNFELNTAFYDSRQVAWLTQWALRLRDQGQPAPLKRSSVFKETLEGLVRIIGFQL